MAGSLSAEQIDAFWNDGFLFPVAAISSADALAARQHFLELMDEPAVTLPRPTNDYARSCFHAVSTEAARPRPTQRSSMPSNRCSALTCSYGASNSSSSRHRATRC